VSGPHESLFLPFAAAFVRGKRLAVDGIHLDDELARTPLDCLSPEQLGRIIDHGLAAGLRLHRFKRTMGLRRVERVLGILRGLAAENLLDIGTGRGAFLWPVLDALPHIRVTAADRLHHRVADLGAVRAGGVERLDAIETDAARLPLDNDAFDGVAMLEVLEHIPDAQSALREAVRVARRFVILSVPSKEDDNPEHVHLFDQPTLQRMLESAGAARANFDYVLNHMIVVANVS
jgi:ubiquinone/menaquinone biosynthesis C-methylase UbiE